MNQLATANQIARQADTDEQVVTMWLHGRSPATARAYRQDIARFQAAVGVPLHQVTLAALQAYAESLAAAELASASRARMLASVKSLFAFCHQLGYLAFDVARPIRLPKIEGKLAERILSEGQVVRMLGEAHEGESATDRRNRVMVLVLYAAGLRVSELCGLQWRHCIERDHGAGQVTVTGKGGKTRAVHLPASVWSQLTALRGDAADAEPVFKSRERGEDGLPRPIDQSQANRIVHATARKAGIEKAGRRVSPHWLRHAHASHSIERGCLDPPSAGHAGPRVCRDHWQVPARSARRVVKPLPRPRVSGRPARCRRCGEQKTARHSTGQKKGLTGHNGHNGERIVLAGSKAQPQDRMGAPVEKFYFPGAGGCVGTQRRAFGRAAAGRPLSSYPIP